MPYLEFPKAVYLGGDTTRESKIVKNAAEEEAARALGFEALPAHPPVDVAQPGGSQHLEFPKILYREGRIDGETKRVEHADAQDVAAGQGFFPLGAVVADAEAVDAFSDEPSGDDASDESASGKRRGGRKKFSDLAQKKK